METDVVSMLDQQTTTLDYRTLVGLPISVDWLGHGSLTYRDVQRVKHERAWRGEHLIQNTRQSIDFEIERDQDLVSVRGPSV
jgi:hypothetical protein